MNWLILLAVVGGIIYLGRKQLVQGETSTLKLVTSPAVIVSTSQYKIFYTFTITASWTNTDVYDIISIYFDNASIASFTPLTSNGEKRISVKLESVPGEKVITGIISNVFKIEYQKAITSIMISLPGLLGVPPPLPPLPPPIPPTPPGPPPPP